MSEPEDVDELERLGTEQVRPELAGLDEMSVAELVDVMCADVRSVPDALVAAKDAIAAAVTGVVEQLARGGRLVYVGAGTAGRLGMLDAAEAGPTFNVASGQVVGILAGGRDAFSVPAENVEDDRAAGAAAIEQIGVSATDAVVGISASGRTPYVLAAIERASARGALTIGVACNARTPLGALADLAVEVPVGPEVIAGSTRMNAGTTQKVVLNILSTAAMVRLGKTYGNLMVDLRPTNDKLRDRAARIVAEIAGVSSDDARRALVASGWATKTAATMLVGSVDAPAADVLLAAHDGKLRRVLDEFEGDSRRGSASAPSARPPGAVRLGVAAALVGGALVRGDVAVRDGLVEAVGLFGGGTGIAVPGMVDAQLNGYAGVDVLGAEPDELLAMGEALLRDGVFAYQPTLISAAPEQLERAIRAIGVAAGRTSRGAEILGVHLEGPFLSPERSGTHPLGALRPPDARLLAMLLDCGDVTMMTLAPELPGALELITLCRRRGVTVSLGHSAATSAQATAGFDAGATAVTHLFNATEPMSARAPGLAGAALTRRDVTVQLIADGVHVDDEMLSLAFAAAPGRCSLVSDAVAAARAGAGDFKLGELTVVVSDGVARREDGTLAGTVAPLREGLKRLGTLSVSLPDAVDAVTRLPVRVVGHGSSATPAGRAMDAGSLRVGGPADLLVLDDQLSIVRILRRGEEIAPA